MNVTIWNEYYEELVYPSVSAHYPDGIHVVLADALREDPDGGGAPDIRIALQQDPEHGLSEEALAHTDVLLWWSHLKDDEVDDGLVGRIARRVEEGMGLIILHSAIGSKVARRVLGTSCRGTGWRHGDAELMWTVMPGHPIMHGLPHPIAVPVGEMYGEPLDVPVPDELVCISSYAGGEVLRSVMTWRRGGGRVVFLAPGHEESPIYFQPEIRLLLRNATAWAAGRPVGGAPVESPRREGEWPMHWWKQEASA
ncbi:MAG: ThuA domain-containing protein [Microbacterium sp.]